MSKKLRFLFGFFVLCILLSFCIAITNSGDIVVSDGNIIPDNNRLSDRNSIYPVAGSNLDTNLHDANGSADLNTPNLIGGDKDDYGCLIAAGYSWCELKQKCLRVWEEPCTDNNTLNTRNQSTDSNDSNVSPIPANSNSGNEPTDSNQNNIISPATMAEIQNRVEAQNEFMTQATEASANETRTVTSTIPVVFSAQSAETVESNPRVISLIAQATAEAKVQIIAPQALSSTSSPQPVAVTKWMVIENVKENDTNIEKVTSGFVFSVKNNTAKRLYDVTLVEVVPKEVALNASEITSIYKFNILESDPVIEFIIPLVEPGESVNINYSVDGNLGGTDLNTSGPPVILFLEETNLAPPAETPPVEGPDSNLPSDKNTPIVPQETQPLPLEIMGIAAVVIVIILLILIIFLRKKNPNSDVQVNTKPEPNGQTNIKLDEQTSTKPESNAQVEVTVPEEQTAPPTV